MRFTEGAFRGSLISYGQAYRNTGKERRNRERSEIPSIADGSPKSFSPRMEMHAFPGVREGTRKTPGPPAAANTAAEHQQLGSGIGYNSRLEKHFSSRNLPCPTAGPLLSVTSWLRC